MSYLGSLASSVVVIGAVGLVSGCPADPGAGPTDAPPTTPCGADGDCDDARFCNGAEACAGDAAAADARGCVPGAPPCTAAECDEALDACSSGCVVPDRDGDGSDAVECGGTDCDDDDRSRAPGRLEICDAANTDEDCDPRTFGVRDADGDGEADALCCNDAGDGTRNCGRDCDDTRAGVGPTSPEVCNSTDDDCDGEIDEGVGARFYRDLDGDGHGDPADAQDDLCAPTTDYPVAVGDDCDDGSPMVFPGAREICNAADDDCSSGGGAEPAEDADADGHTATTYDGCEPVPGALPRDDCDDARAEVHPGADFQREPRCDWMEPCRRAAPRTGWTCGRRGVGTPACVFELASGYVLTWDYDCDLVEEPEPSRGRAACAACEVAPTTCGVCTEWDGFRRCVAYHPGGEPYPIATGACGADVAHETCGGPCAACVATPSTLPLRCR